MYIAFDIETIPDFKKVHLLPPIEVKYPELKLGRMVDPAKIAEKKAEHAEKCEAAELQAYEAKKNQPFEEKMALSPFLGVIASAAFYSPEKQDVLFNEKEIIEKLLSCFRKGHTIITYGGKNFDIMFSFIRGAILGIDGCTVPQMKRYTDRYKSVHHIDLMAELFPSGKSMKLNMVAGGLTGEQKLDFDFRETPELLKTEEGRKKISEYNMQDAKITYDSAKILGFLDDE